MEEIKFEKVSEGIFDKVKTNKEEFVERFIDELEELFPDTVKDGKVDFQALLERFGEYEDRDEKYELTWVGKNKARQESFEDIVGKTLKYIEEDSKNPETTENLYIEGDNLEVLKLLRKSYYGKIKMIYIDPPYNTGNDFVYKDDFTMSKEEYDKLKGHIDEYGNRLVKNSSDSGRYHSNWLNMMYPRLQVARDLLTDDGVIFISIDDNEVHNMKKICDEIFGEDNFVGEIVWHKKTQPSYLSKEIANIKEYILLYKKNSNIDIKTFGGLTDTDKAIEMINISNNIDKRILKKDNVLISDGKFNGVLNPGIYGSGDLKIELLNKINVSSGKPDNNMEMVGRFKWAQNTMNKSFLAGDTYHIKSVDTLRPTVEKKEKIANIKPTIDILSKKFNPKIATNTDANGELKKLFDDRKIMDYPKPVNLVKYLINTVIYDEIDKKPIILDFFSGSATTAHAVMDINAEDSGNRKYIMVQLPETTDEKSVAFKEGYKNICEIGKERIRRAGKKILEDNKDKEGIENLDIGFKVFRVEDTNFKRIVDTSIDADITEMKYKNIKDEEDFNPHFTDLDIVYELMLRRQDIELTEKIKRLDNIGDRTYIVGDTMVVCLEEKITEEMVDNIGNIDGDISWIVLRDSAFDDDCDLKINTTKKLRTIIKESKNKDQKIYWI
ncbi:site-specific DNA-methyltransferase [Clostridium sporogenes]|uniref:site-specific DNA-methyltransferase n=1 Tax=Clostridium sporogenes TaxID=1509 RepID=UPI00313C7369